MGLEPRDTLFLLSHLEFSAFFQKSGYRICFKLSILSHKSPRLHFFFFFFGLDRHPQITWKEGGIFQDEKNAIGLKPNRVWKSLWIEKLRNL